MQANSVQLGGNSGAPGVVCLSFGLFVGLGLGIGAWKVVGFGPSSTLCAGPSFSKHLGGKGLVAAAHRDVMNTLRVRLGPHPPF